MSSKEIIAAVLNVAEDGRSSAITETEFVFLTLGLQIAKQDFVVLTVKL